MVKINAIAFVGLMLAVLMASHALADYVSYEGHKVLRMQINERDSLQLKGYAMLRSNKQFKVDFWTSTDIMVADQHVAQVESLLHRHNIRSVRIIDNVQTLIDRERAHSASVRAQELSQVESNFFADYRNFDEIYAFLDGLSSSYPTLISKKLSIGKSYEGRDLFAYTITGSSSTGKSKIGFLIEGGIHAREWISHATVAYIINNLVTLYGNDATATSLMDSFIFTVVPIVNPDGYNYTWTSDRMWRKTRTPNSGSSCFGTDPNRNWDNHWGVAGASTDPCDDSFMGKAAFSESEVKSMGDFMVALQKKYNGAVKVFIDFHSYSQLWMGPYGWTSTLPKDNTDIENAATAAVNAISSFSGLQYTSGPIYSTIYPASGNSADYAYDQAGITYSYGVELRDQGQYGFELPASQIVPQGQEIWEAIIALCDYVSKH